MNDISEVRRARGRQQIERFGGVGQVAKRMGYRTPSYLVQMFGPNPSRSATEKTMRRMEQALGLPALSLDTEASPAPTQPSTGLTPAQVSEIISLVGTILENEQVTVPYSRFADVVNLAIEDTTEHQGAVREGRIRQVVRLLK